MAAMALRGSFILLWIFSTLPLAGALRAGDAAAAQAEAAQADRASPIPTKEEQSSSLKLIRDLYKDGYSKAKQASEKLALARLLYQQGKATRDDPAGRYVLLLEARDVAVDAGDLGLALEAADEIARRYLAVNAFDLKIQALERAGRQAKTSEANRSLTASSFDLAEEAIRVDNFTVAKRVASFAASKAGKTKHLAAWAAFLTRRATDLEKEYAAVKEALEVLRQRKNDPGASLVVGKFRALLKEDWDSGLELLRFSSDPILKGLSQRELEQSAGKSDPVELGDAWLSASEGLIAPFKSAALRRAVYWYHKAAGSLEGLTKDKLLEKLTRTLAGATDIKPGLMAELFEGKSLKRKVKVRTDPRLDFDWQAGPPDKELPADRFSIRWTGAVRASSPGKYVIAIEYDDGARLWLDEELVLDDWTGGVHRKEIAVYLTDKPHSFHLEQFEENGHAKLRFTWTRSASAVTAVIVYLHDSGDERKARR